MLIISGSGAAAESATSLIETFPGSTVVAADHDVAAQLLAGVHDEALRAAIGDSAALAWVTAGDAQIHVLPVDAGRTVTTRETQLPLQHGSITIPAGTAIEAMALDGPSAGTVRFATSLAASAGLDPWIRYFYATPGAGQPFDGFRFRLFSPQSASLQLSASLDPSRPFDDARNAARLTAADAPLATNFRAPAGAPLTLAPTATSGFKFAFDPARNAGYQVLTGDWQLGSSSGAAELSVLLGLSGSEYVNVPSAWVARFVPNAPAFAPSFQQPGVAPFPLTNGSGGTPITTTWVYFIRQTATPSGPAGYFSQPEAAPYFTTIANAPAGSEILQLLPLVTAGLPQSATGVFGPALASFPMAPYAGIEVPAGGPAGWAATAELFESTVLNPARSAALYAMNRNAGPSGLGPGPTGPSGPTAPIGAVTPQGIFAQFSADGTQWEEWQLATTDHGGQRLTFSDIGGDLREALLSNQLFLVISDPAALLANASTEFLVSDQVLAAAAAASVPQGAIQAATTLRGIFYPDLAAFQPAITNALGAAYAQYVATFIDLAELAQISISGWTFQLGPRHWSKDAGSDALTQTLMIVKFADSDFTTMAGDLSRWTLPASFNGDPAAIQRKLMAFVAAAQQNVATQPDLQYFVDTVLATGAASWNGILFLNAPVPPSEFPPQLRGLAAGLPQNTPFTAHHFGVALAPFDVVNGAINLGDSSLFGLILYDDPAYLVYQSNPYDFKVTSLHVLFKNSAIAAFSSQLQLLVAALFDETSSLQNSTNGDNIVFDGLWQNNGTSDSYSFTFNGENRFVMTSQVLANVIVTDAQFVTMPAGAPTDPSVATRFLLGGSIQFLPQPGFDLFSFGDPTSSDGLRFSNMFVSMEYDPAATPSRTFAFIAAQILFPSGSVARPESLYARFPLQLAAVRQSGVSTSSGGTVISTPSDLGFIPVASPLPEGSLGTSFYGIEMTLNLGSPGALAPKLPFTASLLASWAPGADALNAAVGIKLPGSDGGKKSLTIQGPLKLAIGDITFLQNDSAYLLRFSDIALQFLSLRFPSGGKTNAMLFGDPNPAGGSRTLGWYAAYKKDSGGDSTPALPSPR